MKFLKSYWARQIMHLLLVGVIACLLSAPVFSAEENQLPVNDADFIAKARTMVVGETTNIDGSVCKFGKGLGGDVFFDCTDGDRFVVPGSEDIVKQNGEPVHVIGSDRWFLSYRISTD